jgi:hypothetical protein
MGRYTVLPTSAFDELQMDAGILLKNFDIEAAISGGDGFVDSDIICATTGGVNPTCKPTYSDFADDVDNAPKNVLEFKHLDGWEVALATTGLGTSPELIQLSLGAADIVGGTKIVPRMSVKASDFKDIWWVGDKANGGFVAIQIKNALSNDGFSIQTTKNGKGQLALNIGGHVSLANQKEVPMILYSIDADEPVVPDLTLNKANVSVVVDGTTTVRATTVPSGETVTWSSSDTSKATVVDGVITGVASGSAVVTASMTYDGQTYTDTCNVTVTAGA